MDGLTTKVKTIIEEEYKCKFIGKLTVTVKGSLYIVSFFLAGQTLNPSTTIIQEASSEEDFLKKIRLELRRKGMHYTKFFKLLKCDEHYENNT